VEIKATDIQERRDAGNPDEAETPDNRPPPIARPKLPPSSDTMRWKLVPEEPPTPVD
jgi:hypothetical protein